MKVASIPAILISLYKPGSCSLTFRETSEILRCICLRDMQKKGLGHHPGFPSPDPAVSPRLTHKNSLLALGQMIRKRFSLRALGFSGCARNKGLLSSLSSPPLLLSGHCPRCLWNHEGTCSWPWGSKWSRRLEPRQRTSKVPNSPAPRPTQVSLPPTHTCDISEASGCG